MEVLHSAKRGDSQNTFIRSIPTVFASAKNGGDGRDKCILSVKWHFRCANVRKYDVRQYSIRTLP